MPPKSYIDVWLNVSLPVSRFAALPLIISYPTHITSASINKKLGGISLGDNVTFIATVAGTGTRYDWYHCSN